MRSDAAVSTVVCTQMAVPQALGETLGMKPPAGSEGSVLQPLNDDILLAKHIQLLMQDTNICILTAQEETNSLVDDKSRTSSGGSCFRLCRYAWASNRNLGIKSSIGLETRLFRKYTATSLFAGHSILKLQHFT